MANLSWLFYKGYFDGFTYWNNEPADSQPIQRFFEAKNKKITDTDLVVRSEIPSNRLTFKTTYPGLLIGSGYLHETGMTGEVKLGFHFDHTTGMPVIPGSSVKGVLRSAFPQFRPNKKELWIIDNISNEPEKNKVKAQYIGRDLLEWKDDDEILFSKVHQLEQHIFEGMDVEQSVKEKKAVYYSLYERDIFYDAFPTLGVSGNERKIMGMDAITPHGSNPLKNPIPLPFIKILPGVLITFYFNLNAPDYMEIDSEKRQSLYSRILLDLGIGAKTNVGYGQFEGPYIKSVHPLVLKTRKTT